MARSRPVLPLVLIAILAIALIGMLAAGVWYLLWEGQNVPAAEVVEPDPLGYSQYSVRRARRAVGPRGILAAVIKKYQLRPGGLPHSLDDLVRRPPDLPPEKVWDGPYIHTEGLLSDPWGQQYRYRAPGVHHPDGYDLWSIGPDGQDNTADDIGNWGPP